MKQTKGYHNITVPLGQKVVTFCSRGACPAKNRERGPSSAFEGGPEFEFELCVVSSESSGAAAVEFLLLNQECSTTHAFT